MFVIGFYVRICFYVRIGFYVRNWFSSVRIAFDAWIVVFSDVYSFYGVTNNGDVSVTGLTEGGLYKIYNDQSIEIVGGQKASANGVDILIAGKSGDIWIQAEKNGKVRIRGANITIDADENLDITAGKTVTIKSSRFVVQANQADCDSLTGNLTPNKSSFPNSEKFHRKKVFF